MKPDLHELYRAMMASSSLAAEVLTRLRAAIPDDDQSYLYGIPAGLYLASPAQVENLLSDLNTAYRVSQQLTNRIGDAVGHLEALEEKEDDE